MRSVAIAVAAAALAFAGATARAAGPAPAADNAVSVRPIAAEKLPNVPGKTLTAVVVEFPPGAGSAAHQHAGFVFAYVLEGAVRSALNDGAPRVYQAGEHFAEPPGTRHVVAENASTSERARLLALFIADVGAQLTTR